MHAFAPLQHFNGNTIGRFDKGHAPVTRRAVDGHTFLHQARTIIVDVVNGDCEVAEVAATSIDLRVPVIGQFHWAVWCFGAGDEDQSVTRLLIHMAALLDKAQKAGEENRVTCPGR